MPENTTPPKPRYMEVFWKCERGAKCTNKVRPGLHSEYEDCKACVQQPKRRQ